MSLLSPSQPSASLRARTLVLAAPRHHLTFICLLQHRQPLIPEPATVNPNFTCLRGTDGRTDWQPPSPGHCGLPRRCGRQERRERGSERRARRRGAVRGAEPPPSRSPPVPHLASTTLGQLAASRLSRGTGNKSGRLPTPAGTSARLPEARELPCNTKDRGQRNPTRAATLSLAPDSPQLGLWLPLLPLPEQASASIPGRGRVVHQACPR